MSKALHLKHKPEAAKPTVAETSTSKSTMVQAAKQKQPKKGKKFTTKESMLSILDKVSEVEESRLEKKKTRQNAIKKLVSEKEKRSVEKKAKSGNRLEHMKKQLQQGYSLKVQEKRVAKSQRKNKVHRSLSAINKDWCSSDLASQHTVERSPSIASKKTVRFALD
ncbi:hypothetical protein GGI12_006258 [Dipsacomyces acuminosporus]|nr:hypothetical protein GGI12_006258 [Dipsacomyces acuminosporus]